MRVEFTEMAVGDLEDIAAFISNGSVEAAARFVQKLRAEIQKLSDWPGMGHERGDVKSPHYRFWRVNAYVVAYVVRDDVLHVVRVVHGARDIERMFDPHRSAGVDPQNN